MFSERKLYKNYKILKLRLKEFYAKMKKRFLEKQQKIWEIKKYQYFHDWH